MAAWYLETLLRRWVARSSPQNGWMRTGDTSKPNHRCRLVGREVECDERLDLFSAAPPLETLKFLCSMCATGQTGPDPYRLAVIDIKRAYFYARVRRPIFIELPQLSLYVTRDEVQNWVHEYTTFLLILGFQVGRASLCNFTGRGKCQADCMAQGSNEKEI